MKIRIVGGGLAGCEAAYQLLKRGAEVELREMRGVRPTPCHATDRLAELVCSNSLKSESADTASGQLKGELELLDSLLLRCARACRVPAGGALAVDRAAFSAAVEEALGALPGLTIVRGEVTELPDDLPLLVAAGPLASDALTAAIERALGAQYLSFYDAQAPIVAAESVDTDTAFFAARYDKGDKDYLNCPFTRAQYELFYRALIEADCVPLKDYEKDVFEGCMPVEVMAKRGEDALRYGPLRPVGIRTPDGSRPYAVAQLRKENVAGSAYNLVGFQTNLTFAAQREVFRLIPGLEKAEFLRYGVMHRNTFLNAPAVLTAGGAARGNARLAFAGQLTGVEGYMESVANGLTAAVNLLRRESGLSDVLLPETTIIGQLQRHLTRETDDYQPMNANFGILPPLDRPIRDKTERKKAYYARGIADLRRMLAEQPDGDRVKF